MEIALAPEPTTNTVIFRSGDVSAELQIEGTKISRLIISPEDEVFEVGQEVRFQVIGADEHGNTQPVAPAWTLTGECAQLGGR